MREPKIVVPAKAGTPFRKSDWTPAFAGVTPLSAFAGATSLAAFAGATALHLP